MGSGYLLFYLHTCIESTGPSRPVSRQGSWWQILCHAVYIMSLQHWELSKAFKTAVGAKLIGWQGKGRGIETTALCPWIPGKESHPGDTSKNMTRRGGQSLAGLLPALCRVWCCGLQQFHPSHNFWPCKCGTCYPRDFAPLFFLSSPLTLRLLKGHFRVSLPPDMPRVGIET